MDYKGFSITYDYKDVNRVYRVEDAHTISRFPNFFWAIQYVRAVWNQLNKKSLNYV